MATIKIDPITRIEGHLGVTVEVEDGVVTNAHTEGTMFRGFEKILIGRDPRDAPILTSRICGVCHEVHRLTGLRALENAAGVAVPDAARILRNLIEGVTTIYSHALWIYALGGTDYSDAVAGSGLKRFNFVVGDGYKEAVHNQRVLHEVLAILGGKVPHNMTPAPGGMTFIPNINQVIEIKTRLLEVSDWVGNTADLPEVLDRKLAGEPNDYSLGYAINDVVDLAAYALLAGKANEWGVGPERYLSYGVYDNADGTLFEPRGIWDGSKVIEMDEKKISEAVQYSWYSDDSGGYPGEAKPPEDMYGKGGAYSWAKAPRYDGMTLEAGPLARLVVAGLDPFDLRKNLGGGAAKGSTLNRILARAQETVLLRDKIAGVGLFAGNGMLDELVEALKSGNTSTYTPFEVPDSGFGVGLWEAPRGAVGHWVDIKGKKIDRYQIITPTCWNVSPRDGNGQMGPIEQALIGVPVPDTSNPINVVRTVRSFDPCLACTVHVMTPDGKKYSIEASRG